MGAGCRTAAGARLDRPSAEDPEGGQGEQDIWVSQKTLDGKKWQKPQNLGSLVNSKYDEGDVLISPDESYIIVCCNNRPDGFGSGDLYISFKDENNNWSKLINMGEDINSNESDFCPTLSPDGKYFFFTSGRSGKGDIYWVDVNIIQKIKNNN